MSYTKEQIIEILKSGKRTDEFDLYLKNNCIDLTDANLESADLTGANLRDVYLAFTDLTGSNLTGANK